MLFLCYNEELSIFNRDPFIALKAKNSYYLVLALHRKICHPLTYRIELPVYSCLRTQFPEELLSSGVTDFFEDYVLI